MHARDRNMAQYLFSNVRILFYSSKTWWTVPNPALPLNLTWESRFSSENQDLPKNLAEAWFVLYLSWVFLTKPTSSTEWTGFVKMVSIHHVIAHLSNQKQACSIEMDNDSSHVGECCFTNVHPVSQCFTVSILSYQQIIQVPSLKQDLLQKKQSFCTETIIFT